MYSGLKDELSLLVVNNKLDILVALLNNPVNSKTPWVCYDRHEHSLDRVEGHNVFWPSDLKHKQSGDWEGKLLEN